MLTAATKTFNIAGTLIGNVTIPDEGSAQAASPPRTSPRAPRPTASAR